MMSLMPAEYALTQEIVHTCPKPPGCGRQWTAKYMACARPKRLKYCDDCRSKLFPATPAAATSPPPPPQMPPAVHVDKTHDHKLRQAGDE